MWQGKSKLGSTHLAMRRRINESHVDGASRCCEKTCTVYMERSEIVQGGQPDTEGLLEMLRGMQEYIKGASTVVEEDVADQ
eukprot:10033857-Karenia_brevis.AAC.1